MTKLQTIFLKSLIKLEIEDYNSISIDTEQDLANLVEILNSDAEKKSTNENNNNEK